MQESSTVDQNITNPTISQPTSLTSENPILGRQTGGCKIPVIYFTAKCRVQPNPPSFSIPNSSLFLQNKGPGKEKKKQTNRHQKLELLRSSMSRTGKSSFRFWVRWAQFGRSSTQTSCTRSMQHQKLCLHALLQFQRWLQFHILHEKISKQKKCQLPVWKS